jgi:peptidoglycan/xylan/chitin deacetylase (PgdA/CDA1 family)
MARELKKYVILAFDMETDIGSYLKSYRGVRNGTPRILEALRRQGLPATFLFTAEAAEQNRDITRSVAEAGFEVGCHSFRHETVGEARFNMPNDTPILDSEVEHRLALNRAIVAEICGRQPETFRAPRLWQGNAQVQALEKLGFAVDASYSVAAQRTRILPYHPSREDWREEGDLKLLEIPNFAFLDHRNDYSRFFCRNDQWPLLRLLGADFVLENSRDVVDRQASSSDIAVLLFYLHPWEFEPMPETVEYDEGSFHFRPELHANCGDPMAAEFERYLRLALGEGYEFTTCRDFCRIWIERRC